jgi:transcription initiation factor TFIID subunit 10
VTNYYLTLAGLPPPPTTPLPLARLLALASQKFMADVAADAYQYSRIRASTTSSNALAGIPGVGPQLPGAPGVGAEKEKGGDKGKNANLGMQRAGFGGGGSGGSGRTVLTMEDLGMAVGEYGISVRRGEVYR